MVAEGDDDLGLNGEGLEAPVVTLMGGCEVVLVEGGEPVPMQDARICEWPFANFSRTIRLVKFLEPNISVI